MIELGLQRIGRLLAQTALPWRAIHVAGTNGKGSICAYISGMLDAYNNSDLRRSMNQATIRHGRFTSPHLVDRWDCITLNRKPVSFPVFENVEEVVLKRNQLESIAASEFELLTATAFEIFTREKVDVAVVETGMGGRLDATNIIGQSEGLDQNGHAASLRPPPLVTAFSSIGMDHQDFLGNTLEAIATEKAGILKPRVPVAFAWSNPASLNQLIASLAAAKQCPPTLWEQSDGTMTLRYNIEDHATRLGLDYVGNLPPHTVTNLSVAFQATSIALQGLRRLPEDKSILSKQKADLDRAMLDVVKTTSFPGRQQQISLQEVTGRSEPVLLDGAHNYQSALALANTVNALRTANGSRKSVTWVLAVSSSKDVKEILSPILEDGDSLFAVEFGAVDGMPWVKPCQARRITEKARTVVVKPDSLTVHAFGTDVRGALDAATRAADEGPLVVAGSLYLVGDVLRLLRA